MDHVYLIRWLDKGVCKYTRAWGILSLKSHMDYILSTGGTITNITNESV